jgi:hypothetical protein
MYIPILNSWSLYFSPIYIDSAVKPPSWRAALFDFNLNTKIKERRMKIKNGIKKSMKILERNIWILTIFYGMVQIL